MKKPYTIIGLAIVFAVALIAMIGVLVFFGRDEQAFTPPAFEQNAIAGVPDLSEEQGYTELYQEGMAYRVSLCGIVTMDGLDANVYLTNAQSNEKYLKLRVLDQDGTVLGETGLLKPGEYVTSVKLNRQLEEGMTIKLKIMGYEPEDYSSAGSVNLTVYVGSVQ